MQKEIARRAQTRQSIVEAAEQLFLANGYNGTSMRQIARHAGVALGGIYNYFGSKEELFFALLEERLPAEEVLNMLAAVEGRDGAEMLGVTFENLLVLAREQVDYFALILTDIREFEGRNIRHLGLDLLPGMHAFAQRIQAAGGLRDDVDELVLMRLFISLMLGFMVTDLIAYSGEQPLMPGLPRGQAVRDSVKDVLLHGMLLREDGDG